MQDKTKLLIWFRNYPPSSRKFRQCHLDKFQPYPFLGINNITAPVKKGSRRYDWLTTEETRSKNYSITYINDSVDNSILDAEGNACGIIAIPIIQSAFENDYVHALHDLLKRYIYGYLISKLISLEHDITNICLLLIWGEK